MPGRSPHKQEKEMNVQLTRTASTLVAFMVTGLATAPCPAASDAKPRAVVTTSKGEIELELDAVKAPISVANFKEYCQSGFYAGTVFHRVISGFMIQGGGLTADFVEKPTRAPIINEAGNGLSNKRGTVAMARTNVVDSATGQFFINVVDNARLDQRDRTQQGFGYAVFGAVVRGMDVVDAIRNLPTGTKNGMRDVPNETVTIQKCEWRAK
jgi:cyclophilin family peptidyl-prolyl cis-trans isomerase